MTFRRPPYTEPVARIKFGNGFTDNKYARTASGLPLTSVKEEITCRSQLAGDQLIKSIASKLAPTQSR